MATTSLSSPMSITIPEVNETVRFLATKRTPSSVHSFYRTALESADRATDAMREISNLLKTDQNKQNIKKFKAQVDKILKSIPLLINGLSLKVLTLPTLDEKRHIPKAPEPRHQFFLRTGLELPGVPPPGYHTPKRMGPLPTETEVKARDSLRKQITTSRKRFVGSIKTDHLTSLSQGEVDSIFPIQKNEVIQAAWKQWLSLYSNNLLLAATELKIYTIFLHSHLNALEKTEANAVETAIAGALQKLHTHLSLNERWSKERSDADQWSKIDKAMLTNKSSLPEENKNFCDAILGKLEIATRRIRQEEHDSDEEDSVESSLAITQI